jgi:hypothetical protein
MDSIETGLLLNDKVGPGRKVKLKAKEIGNGNWNQDGNSLAERW